MNRNEENKSSGAGKVSEESRVNGAGKVSEADRANIGNGLIEEARKSFDAIFEQYSNLCEDESVKNEWMERHVGFLEGTKTLPLTYDPVFKRYLIWRNIKKGWNLL